MIVKEILRTLLRNHNRRKYIRRIHRMGFGEIHDSDVINSDFDYAFIERIRIKENVQIGVGAKFYAIGGITVEEGCVISDFVQIRTASHNYDSEDLQYLPFDGRSYCKPVHIGKNVWIGTDVLILPGVTIGEGAVIGAGSVVTKDVETCAVVGGNPAKIIKYRNKERYIQLVEQGKIYVKAREMIPKEFLEMESNIKE